MRLNNGGEVNRLGVGQYFGEVSVLEGTPPTASVVAVTDELQTVALTARRSAERSATTCFARWRPSPRGTRTTRIPPLSRGAWATRRLCRPRARSSSARTR